MSAERARLAIAALFTLHGLLIGTWVPNIPLAKERLDVGTGAFGFALLFMAAGAVCAMPVAGALVNKAGSARVTILAGLAMGVSLILPVLAPGLPAFAAGIFVFGAATGSMDVAMNAHGIAVERELRRPVMSFLHGMFSLGAAAGAVLGAMVIRQTGALPFTIAMQAVVVAGLVIASRYCLPPHVDKGLAGASFAMPTRATIGLGLMCFLALMAEGAVLDWAAIHLRETFTLDAAVAGLGYALFSVGMMVSRFLGDSLRERFGSIPLVRGSALLMAAGLAGALLIPNAPLAIAAYTIAGIGIGNIAPVLFAGGGRAEPGAPGRGIAAVTTLGYAGFIGGPPLIGITAEYTGLALALGLMIPASAIMFIAAGLASAADAGRRAPA